MRTLKKPHKNWKGKKWESRVTLLIQQNMHSSLDGFSGIVCKELSTNKSTKRKAPDAMSRRETMNDSLEFLSDDTSNNDRYMRRLQYLLSPSQPGQHRPDPPLPEPPVHSPPPPPQYYSHTMSSPLPPPRVTSYEAVPSSSMYPSTSYERHLEWNRQYLLWMQYYEAMQQQAPSPSPGRMQRH